MSLKNYPYPIEYSVLLSEIRKPFKKPLEYKFTESFFLTWPASPNNGFTNPSAMLLIVDGFVVVECTGYVWQCPIEDPDVIEKAQAELRSFGVK